MIDASYLHRALSYDANTGEFRWKEKTCSKVVVGQVAGATNAAGYRVIGLRGRLYYAHRIAWLMTHGHDIPQIDHRDGDRANNRISNLRPASHQQNVFNAKRAENNTSGRKGVSWHKAAGKWSAQAFIDGRPVYLGLFNDREDAHRAYIRAVERVQPEFVRAS